MCDRVSELYEKLIETTLISATSPFLSPEALEEWQKTSPSTKDLYQALNEALSDLPPEEDPPHSPHLDELQEKLYAICPYVKDIERDWKILHAVHLYGDEKLVNAIQEILTSIPTGLDALEKLQCASGGLPRNTDIK